MSHLIEKIVVNIHTQDKNLAIQEQDLISQRLNNTSFLSLLSQSLDKFSDQTSLHRFEKIELKLDLENADSFGVNLIKALQQFLILNHKKEHLIAEGNENNDLETSHERQSSKNNIAILALFYLKNGYHDWHVRKQQKHQIQEFLENYVENPSVSFDTHILDGAMEDSGLAGRLYHYLGEVKFLQFIERHPAHPGIRVFQNYRIPEKDQSPVNRIAPETHRMRSSLPSRKINPEGVPEKVFYTEHAGVVLLSPFFTQLFKQLEYTRDHQFTNLKGQEKSFLALQYLVWGESDALIDFGCPLLKILVGLPIDHLISKNVTLPDSDMQLINQLLQFSLRQWPVLKNTSPVGLQQSFLQRPGRLSVRQDGNWELLVERKTIDVLLDRLPPGWTYTMLRLPWMTKFIYVIW